MTDEPETTDESLDDVDEALESAGFVDGDEETEEEQSKGWLDKLGDLSGTGKSLDNYENDPIASIWEHDDGTTPRGAKHIARGVDGLSPFAAAHPFIDIAVGFVLLAADEETDTSLFEDNETPSKDDELDDLGDMT